ncbi:putative ribonuclease H-like domain-containing protein [Tanacetum coccineum]
MLNITGDLIFEAFRMAAIFLLIMLLGGYVNGGRPLTADNISSTNEAVNTAHDVSTASSQGQTSFSTYADDVKFSFFATQSNSLQLDNKDLEQIDTDDLEEMDLKWALRNQGNRNGDNTRRVVLVETNANALVVQDGIGSSSLSSSDSEVHTCSKNYLKSYEALQKQYDQQREALNKANIEIICYQMGLESLKARIVVHQKNEAVFEEDIAFLKYDVKSKLNNSEVVHSAFNNRDSDVDDNSVNDRLKTSEGFHEVSPSYTGNYMPPRPDLSFAGLDDSVFKSAVSETTASVHKSETSASKTNKKSMEKPKSVKSSAPLIEDWESDSDNDSVFRRKSNQTKPKFTKINFVKSGENVKSVNKENTHRQAEYTRKSQSPMGNGRNWNGMMTQKLRNGFEFIKKACFVCGSFNYLIKDYDFHDNKMVEKPVLNNKGRVTGQKKIRPVWNNAQRVNHQNKLTRPHPKRNFVPTAVLTKSGQIPVNAAKQSSNRTTVSVNTARHVNTDASKPKVNDALPITYFYFKAHSPVRRPFNQKSTAKTNKRVNTARVNNVTTAGPKAVVSTAEGIGKNAVKSSACWIWRPTGNVIDHTSKDSGSYMLKRFGYADPQGRLNECSRHMTRNKFYLSDYQDIDGGFVAFGESAKGGKITGKGKIRTGKLDFEDVYFVKELKFNLFSVSQMCDKKNSVLFTETGCLVLSPDFKLLDESQVLLKIPRQNNMYSFDLKNVVPSGDLTWLFAKATIDEYNLWHRRLGYINFKTMNKLVRGNLVRGLPSKLFENDHSCVACQKGKQHKASCTGPNWMFDIDTLSMSMNYQPVFIGNQTNGNAGLKSSEDDVAEDDGKKNGVKNPAKESDINGLGEATNTNSTNKLNTISSPVNTVSSSFTTVDPGRERDQRNEFESVFGQDKDANGNSNYRMFTPVNVATLSNDDFLTDPLMPDLEDTADLQDTGIFSDAYDDEDVGAEGDINNLETTMNVSPIPTTRIHRDHPKDQIIGDINSATQTRRMIKMSEEHAILSYINKQRRTNHKDYQNCLFACFLSQIEPKKVIQALADSSWVEAMQEELLQFRLQKV